MAVVMFCTVVMPVTAPASWETALLLMCWFHKYPVEMTESKKKRGGWKGSIYHTTHCCKYLNPCGRNT